MTIDRTAFNFSPIISDSDVSHVAIIVNSPIRCSTSSHDHCRLANGPSESSC